VELTDPVAAAMLGVAAADPQALNNVYFSAPLELFREAAEIGRAADEEPGSRVMKGISDRLANVVLNSVVSSNVGKAMIVHPAKLKRGLSKAMLTVPLQAQVRADETWTSATISRSSALALIESIANSIPRYWADSPRVVAIDLTGKVETTYRPAAPTSFQIDAPGFVRDAFEGLDFRALIAPTNPFLKIIVWDLDANVEWLTAVTKVLNGCQDVFRFYTLDAPVPAGLISRPSKVREWATKPRTVSLGKMPKKIKPQTIIDSEFFRVAKELCLHLRPRPDLLVGVTPAWVAGRDEYGEPHFDFYSSAAKQLALVSTTDLRETAAAVGRPFEVAVAITMIAQMLVTLNRNLEFHDHRDRKYCVFDEPNRAQWKRILLNPEVGEECMERMKGSHSAALVQMLAALRSYTRPITEFTSDRETRTDQDS